jgi:hypothetical protein
MNADDLILSVRVDGSPRLKRLPPVEYLQECLTISDDGKLVWLHRPRRHFRSDGIWKAWNGNHAGEEAGSANRKGYLLVCVGNVRHMCHRIIFKMTYGFEPAMVDHIDMNKANNRPSNLRAANAEESYRAASIKYHGEFGRRARTTDHAKEASDD